MSERSGTTTAAVGGGGGGGGGGAASALVSDQEIADALQNILRETNPNVTGVSLNGVVQQLESKLGLGLSHKVDFITSQINHFYQIQAQARALAQIQAQAHISSIHQQKQQQQNDRFAPYRNPNYHPHPPTHFPPNFSVQRPEVYGGFRPPPQPQPHLQPHPHSLQPPAQQQQQQQQHPVQAVGHTSPQAVAAVAEAPKVSAQPARKRRGGPGGLNKLCGVSPELQTIVGQPTLPRTEIVKQLWAYIRKNNLQDPNNKRKIICNDELRLVFEVDCTDMFKMNKLLAKHIIPLDTTESSKKPKVEVESGSENVDSVPIVVISEALANFFGTGEREMSQAEVLRQVWEYIKANQLEDPLNAMAIHCDAKLQELFGCESISALGIPEMLAHRHLSNKS